MLDVLQLSDCTITIDAMGTQKAIAKTIVEHNNGYVLALKANHSKFYKDVFTYFEETIQNKELYFENSILNTQEEGHGRIESRIYYLETDIDRLQRNL